MKTKTILLLALCSALLSGCADMTDADRASLMQGFQALGDLGQNIQRSSASMANSYYNAAASISNTQYQAPAFPYGNHRVTNCYQQGNMIHCY